MKPTPTVDRLLERIEILKDTSDLDLLLFFHRHPRVLLAADDLAALVGCDVQQIARSLDALMAAGLLQRSQNHLQSARMYVLDLSGPTGGWVPALMRVASTRAGRAAVIGALKARRGAGGAQAMSRRARPRGVVTHA